MLLPTKFLTSNPNGDFGLKVSWTRGIGKSCWQGRVRHRRGASCFPVSSIRDFSATVRSRTNINSNVKVGTFLNSAAPTRNSMLSKKYFNIFLKI